MKNRKTLEDQLFEIGLVFLFITAAGITVYELYLKNRIVFPPCVFNTFFGLYCPGCGGTRAVEALLHGHLLKSLWYHPIVLYTAVIYGGFMGSHMLKRFGVKRIKGWKFHNWYLFVAVGIIAVNFIVKNILRIRFGILM